MCTRNKHLTIKSNRIVLPLLLLGWATHSLSVEHAAAQDDAQSAPDLRDQRGEVAPGCIDESPEESSSVMESCGPETAQPRMSEQDEPSSRAEVPVLGQDDTLSASTDGASVRATVHWTGSESFELRDVRLSDTACDAHPVYFHAIVPGFQFPDHTNNLGCHAGPATWGSLRGSLDGGIFSLWLEVCRDDAFDNCGQSNSSRNSAF